MDEDELQADQLDTDGDDDAADSGSDNSAPPDNAQAPKGEGKRVNDLMGKWQAEQARANRLERELAAARGTKSTDQADDTQGDNGAAEVDEFKEFARENARTTLFNSDPRLAEAGLSVEDIAGTTLTEMRASVKKHLKVVDGIEGRLRNKLLAEHGLDPDVATGQGTEKAPSFSTMTDKEFNDYLAARDSRLR
jgi:hypothetical protein